MFTNHIEQPFIVIGMHRSGTTMLAEAMNKSGIFMGVMRDHNSEAFHFLSLNQQMLAAAGADWITPKAPGPEHDRTIGPYEIFAEHIKSESASPRKLRLLNNMAWGWKDPRNTFTLGVWLKRFPQAKVIHVIRDGRAVTRSLQTRNTIAGEVHDSRLAQSAFCFSLWENYVTEGLKWAEKIGSQYLALRFEDLVGADKNVRLKLDQFVGKQVGLNLENRSKSGQIYSDEINAFANESALFAELGYTV